MSDCKCDLRTRLVGDGCEQCNPQMAIELLQERLDELRSAADQADEEYLAEIARLRLTDEEREAVESCIADDEAATAYQRAATLRELLDRMSPLAT